MYVDSTYYAKEYLAGCKEPIIPDESFRYWERQAEKEINKFTYGRIIAHSELISDNVKDCVCEIAELLYRADNVAEQALEQGGAGLLSSYNNDGESGTFDLSQSVYTEEGKAKKISDIIHKHLAYTGLLYAGVM